jgi:para-nitrobenzyl esterase
MKVHISAVAVALAFAAAVHAAEPPTAASQPTVSLLALAGVPARSGTALSVSSPAFQADGDIPFENTQYRGNIFPGLSWASGPAGTRSYAVIMQDPDALFGGKPILHWTMFNIPAPVTKLDAGVSTPPAGASYGPNIRGPSQPYMGPHTPPGPKHHYHIQVFALDTTLGPDAGGGYAALTAAMRDHVLASGELVGLAQVDPNAPPRVPHPAATAH